MTTALARTAPARRTTVAAAVLLALLVSLLVPATATAADAGAEQAFVAAVNRERAAAGLPALAVAGDLVAVARRQSVRMADAADLHHNPDLGGEVGGWQKVGENVGRGPSVDPIHRAFMESPGHRQNILDGAWTEVGIGVEVRDGTIWVTEVFRQPEAAPAPPPPPAPEPEPAPAAQAPAPAPAASAAEAEAPAAATPTPTPEATPDAPAGDRALVMLTRVAADDAAIDAA